MNLTHTRGRTCGGRSSLDNNERSVSKTIERIVRVLNSERIEHRALRGYALHLYEADRWRRGWEKTIANPTTLQRLDILRLLREAASPDEALWCAFLAGHFGRSSAAPSDKAQTESPGLLLCGFGSQPIWTWSRVNADPNSFRSWLFIQQDKLSTLRFGNHRKFESNQPEALFKVISSFVEWVRFSGGSPSQALAVSNDVAPEEGFDLLFRSLNVQRFGRTGKFDMLCLIGDLGLIKIRPGSCYLSGSTGPLRGAIELFGQKTPAELTRLSDRLAKKLGVAVEVFEDALCNWQKQMTP